MSRNIYLLGFMGSGKTTVGRALADRLGFAWLDLDEEIEARAGTSVAAIFTLHGEGRFRDVEAEALGDVCGRQGCVVSTGGGVVLRPENRAAMERSGMTVWLAADIDTLMARLAGKTAARPLLAGHGEVRARIGDLLAAREPLYEETAHARLDTDAMTVAEIVDALAAMWRQYLPQPQAAPAAPGARTD